MKTLAVIIGVIMLFMAGLIGYLIGQPVVVEQPVGSVSRASEYNHVNMRATTTGSYVFKTAPGTLGSVIVATLGTGNIIFYDATTTNANLRVLATSSLNVLATVDASQAAGTYTYDMFFRDGLIGVFNGTQGTSTVTFR